MIPRTNRLPSTNRRGVSVLAVAVVVAVSAPALAASSHQSANARVSVRAGAIPAWARGVRPAASEPAKSVVRLALSLTPRNAGELSALASSVSNPNSSDYRHFLTTAHYDARFAPTAASAALARNWLRAQGLTVDGTTPGNGVVYAHGAAARVATAFHTSFARFRVAGALLRSPLSQPQIPASLAGIVGAVDGLAQTEMHSTAAPSPAFVNARPCSKYFGQKIAKKQLTYRGKHQALAVCGYSPKQVRSAYGIGPKFLTVNGHHLTGKGVTVAVVDAFASPTVEADANTYSHKNGLPAFKAGQFTQTLLPGATATPEVNVLGLGAVDPQGWAGEETLDVEAVHAMAPGANVHYYGALTPEDVTLFTALAEAIEGGKAQVVSDSFASSTDDPDPADLLLFNTLMNQAAVKGITVDFSSGDDGDNVASQGFRTADFPATSTGVTAVGGTTVVVNKAGKQVATTYWGTEKVPMLHGKWDFKDETTGGAGGGGVSTSYAEPSWQKGIVPTSEATYGGVKPGRVLPDVSMIADPTTGFLMGQTQTFASGAVRYSEYRIGGTSVACPMFSGVIALADQLAGHGIGLITPTLYSDSRTTAGRLRLFTDPSAVKVKGGHTVLANVRPDFTITDNPSSAVVYTLRTLGNLGSLHARKGFDDSTGLGSPKAPALVSALG